MLPKKNRLKVKNWQLTLMILPCIIYFFVFSYIPMAGLALAFENYTYTGGLLSEFVGFSNFKFLFLTGAAWRITKNTILFNLAFIVVNLIVQLTCAIALTEFCTRRFQKRMQAVMFLPYVVSWVVVGAVVYNIFNYEHGFLNSLLGILGLAPINVYSDAKAWPYILIFFNMWKKVGYGTIIYTAAILGIDQELYAAARIDGASSFQQIIHITIPLLKPTIVILLLLDMSCIVRGDFNMFFNVTGNNAMLYSTTDIIETYVYRALTATGDVGMGAAASLYQSVIGFIFIITSNGIIKKIYPDYALF